MAQVQQNVEFLPHIIKTRVKTFIIEFSTLKMEREVPSPHNVLDGFWGFRPPPPPRAQGLP